MNETKSEAKGRMQCGTCGARFTFLLSQLGASAKCKQCGEPLKLREQSAVPVMNPEVAKASTVDDGPVFNELPPEVKSRTPKPAVEKATSTPQRSLRLGSMSQWGGLVLGVGIVNTLRYLVFYETTVEYSTGEYGLSREHVHNYGLLMNRMLGSQIGMMLIAIGAAMMIGDRVCVALRFASGSKNVEASH